MLVSKIRGKGASMGEQAAITIRVDKEVKEDAVRIFKAVGLSFNSAIEIYLRAVVREKRIPFELVYDESIDKD